MTNTAMTRVTMIGAVMTRMVVITGGSNDEHSNDDKHSQRQCGDNNIAIKHSNDKIANDKTATTRNYNRQQIYFTNMKNMTTKLVLT